MLISAVVITLQSTVVFHMLVAEVAVPLAHLYRFH